MWWLMAKLFSKEHSFKDREQNHTDSTHVGEKKHKHTQHTLEVILHLVEERWLILLLSNCYFYF